MRYYICLYDMAGHLLHEHKTFLRKRAVMMLQSALLEVLDPRNETQGFNVYLGRKLILWGKRDDLTKLTQAQWN